MSERRAGSTVNVSSVAGLTGSPMLTAYAASKWAVRGMTKVLAKELARFGVRVNSLHPGQIDTDMNARQRERTPEPSWRSTGARAHELRSCRPRPRPARRRQAAGG